MPDAPDITGSLIIRPGDTLVLRTSAMTPTDLADLADSIRAGLPDEIKVLVLAGVEQIAVYRPGEQVDDA